MLSTLKKDVNNLIKKKDKSVLLSPTFPIYPPLPVFIFFFPSFKSITPPPHAFFIFISSYFVVSLLKNFSKMYYILIKICVKPYNETFMLVYGTVPHLHS